MAFYTIKNFLFLGFRTNEFHIYKHGEKEFPPKDTG